MKIPKYLSLMAGIIFCLHACQTDLMDYEGEAGVYFAVQHPWPSGAGDTITWEMSPISNISFFLQEKKDSTIDIRVQLLGNPVAHDRYFKVTVVDTGTTAKVGHDYDPVEEIHTLPANAHYADMKIKLYKQADLSGRSRSLMLRLEETADFRLPFGTWYPWPTQHKWSPNVGAPEEDISAIEHTILISDVVQQPEGWWPGLLGTFTVKKFNMMCEMFDLTIQDFSSNTVMTSSRAKAYGQRFDAYLEAQRKAGNEILEDDGTPMKMGIVLYN